MDKKEFEKVITEKAKQIEITLTAKQIEQFYQYMELLIEWNQKINLTAIVEEKEIIEKHFIDCLTIVKHIKPNTSLIDVGTGAGFPGIPIKIVREDVKVTLLDSLNKRINFLNEVIQQLGLEKIEAVHARVEEAGKNKNDREKYDVATSRAVANLTTLSEYMLPLVKLNGISICMKGPDVEEEMEASKKAIHILGGKIVMQDKLKLPDSDIKRNNIIISKVEKTPMKYPRKAGTPAREPIQ